MMAAIFGYAVWGRLLQIYSKRRRALRAARALHRHLASSLIVGEALPPLREAGMGLILAGLAIVVVPATMLENA